VLRTPGARQLLAALRLYVSTRRSYRAVVTAFECPTSSCTVSRSTPASSSPETYALLLCRARHSRSYAEFRIMPSLLDFLCIGH